MSNDMVKRIGSIKFSCLSPEEIRKMSAVKVITADTYNDEGFPYEGGLMDTSLGVVEPGLKCKTCGCKSGECPGHFGHIDLALPVNADGTGAVPYAADDNNTYNWFLAPALRTVSFAA